MKSIVALTVMFNTIFGSYGQDIPESQVPSVVKNTFLTSFTATTDVEWEKEKDLYVVEFEINTVDHKAYIDANGKLLKVKADMPVDQLPQAVKAAIEKDYPGYTTDEAESIKQSGVTTYRVEVEKGLVEYKVIYSAEGKLLEKNAGIN
ncbi:PepSY-like domain-containing protein [Rhodocytophaga aerolata]|uniref:PepSY-like domain-containing protein n=1 Tax=Rhodocytophaga aerolata TaxID=455078 RepID=A0ABT8RDK1_9BACT|nr:PepSY-like domain-containing protein [Rhodocytophaga aerolata]MDO1449424.1 PepSY-like domain-containing protein [Rhodocytophaga aerolata]